MFDIVIQEAHSCIPVSVDSLHTAGQESFMRCLAQDAPNEMDGGLHRTGIAAGLRIVKCLVLSWTFLLHVPRVRVGII